MIFTNITKLKTNKSHSVFAFPSLRKLNHDTYLIAVHHVFYVTCSKQNNLCGRDLMNKVGIKITGLDESLKVNNIDYVGNTDMSVLLNSYHG